MAALVRRRPNGVALFIDVETTGLYPAQHEIIELAAALFTFQRSTGAIIGVLDEYVGLRQPGRSIPGAVTRVHGITDADVCGCQLDLPRISAMMDQAEFVVAHNARFDHRFVTRLLPLAQTKPWRCSMYGVAWAKHGYPSRSLQALLKDHGIAVARAHRGQDDVRAALALLSRAGVTGAPYFREVLRSAAISLVISSAKPFVQ